MSGDGGNIKVSQPSRQVLQGAGFSFPSSRTPVYLWPGFEPDGHNNALIKFCHIAHLEAVAFQTPLGVSEVKSDSSLTFKASDSVP